MWLEIAHLCPKQRTVFHPLSENVRIHTNIYNIYIYIFSLHILPRVNNFPATWGVCSVRPKIITTYSHRSNEEPLVSLALSCCVPDPTRRCLLSWWWSGMELSGYSWFNLYWSNKMFPDYRFCGVIVPIPTRNPWYWPDQPISVYKSNLIQLSAENIGIDLGNIMTGESTQHMIGQNRVKGNIQ